MGLDPRGFMDGAFRGFQMMESYYDRQDRKQERADSLRRVDERQQIEDQRYADNLQRDKERREEEVAWRKQVHEDNNALKSLRYATGGRGVSQEAKEYRQQVTKLMTWKRDALSKLNQDNLDKDGYEAAVSSIEKQYQSGMNDINSLYASSGVEKVTPPSKNPTYYEEWADTKKKKDFLLAVKERGINFDDFNSDSLERMYESALRKQSTVDNDASLILSMKDKGITSASNIELPKPVSLRSASEVMNQSAMQNYSNAIAGKTQFHFSAPVLNAGVLDHIREQGKNIGKSDTQKELMSEFHHRTY